MRFVAQAGNLFSDGSSEQNIVIEGSSVTYAVDGTDIALGIMMGYLTFTSSDPSVVSVSGEGVITAVGGGTAELTAVLGSAKSVPATGTVTVNVTPPEAVPTESAAAPTVHPDSVLSLFSDAYTGHPVDTWSPGWDGADVEDYLIGADSTKDG